MPDEYTCPITSEIMTDPVSTEDGFTYERAAITEWLRTIAPREVCARSPVSCRCHATHSCRPRRLRVYARETYHLQYGTR